MDVLDLLLWPFCVLQGHLWEAGIEEVTSGRVTFARHVRRCSTCNQVQGLSEWVRR